MARLRENIVASADQVLQFMDFGECEFTCLNLPPRFLILKLFDVFMLHSRHCCSVQFANSIFSPPNPKNYHRESPYKANDHSCFYFLFFFG